MAYCKTPSISCSIDAVHWRDIIKTLTIQVTRTQRILATTSATRINLSRTTIEIWSAYYDIWLEISTPIKLIFEWNIFVVLADAQNCRIFTDTIARNTRNFTVCI